MTARALFGGHCVLLSRRAHVRNRRRNAGSANGFRLNLDFLARRHHTNKRLRLAHYHTYYCLGMMWSCITILLIYESTQLGINFVQGAESVYNCPVAKKDGLVSSHRRIWRSAETFPKTPPRFTDLSSKEQAYFTRCGAIPLEESMLVDDSGPPGGTFYQYSSSDVLTYVESASVLVSLVREHGAAQGAVLNARRTRRRKPTESEIWLLEALHNHFSELNKTKVLGSISVLIFGSISPWVEALCLAFGATATTTVEYNRLSYNHSAMKTMTSQDFWAAIGDFKFSEVGAPFDAILSISSFDHDGLGRYGDPIAPDGDILTMRSILNHSDQLLVSEETSGMLLTVPLGPDLLAWNLMRRYGRVRLPLLLKGWKLIQTYGFDNETLDLPNAGKPNFRQTWEPVLVLAPSKNKQPPHFEEGTLLRELDSKDSL